LGISKGSTKEEALVLRSIRHGETSRIVTLFGRSIGKFAVIAKGTRKGRGSVAGSAIEPPALVEALVYFKPSRSIQILGQVSLLQGYSNLKGDLASVGYAAVVHEHLNRCFTEGDASPDAYDSAKAALLSLDVPMEDRRLILWRFQMNLARAIGFALYPSICPVCERQPALTGIRNLLWLERGAICCEGCRPEAGTSIPISGESVSILRRLVENENRPLLNLKPSRQAQIELTQILVNFLRFHHTEIGNLPALEMLNRFEERD